MSTSDKRVNQDSALAALLRRARTRHIFQVLLDEGALAAAIALGGAIVLLVLGTQILDWYWLAALCAAGVAVGGWRAGKRFVSRYRIARRLDDNLALNDALSTALYFSEHPERTTTPRRVVEQQRAMAQQAARAADLRRGMPFVFSGRAYAAGGLALAAMGVFGLRYGVNRTVDLRPSLVQIAFDGIFGTPDSRAAAERGKKYEPHAKNWKNPETLKTDPWQAQTLDQSGAPDSALNTIDTPNVDNSNATGPAADPKANGNKSTNTPDSTAESADDAERSAGTPNEAPDGGPAPSSDNKSGAPPPGADQKGQSAGENASLAEKMRDAFANLLSKLKMQPKGGSDKSGGSQKSQAGSQQQSAQNKQAGDQNGAPTQGKPQSDAKSSPDGQSSQDAQSSEQAKNGQGKSNGKSDGRSDSQQGKSGIGSEDGDKSIKEAEQLAAMGKISEIIGKRSQNVTGEVMVEVASGNQQLRTQYSQRKAAHADTGGEIGRDEVPLAYRQYVQQYFEEIHKLPASGSKKTGKDAAKE